MKTLSIILPLFLSLVLTNALAIAIPAPADSTGVRLATRDTLAPRALCGLGKSKKCDTKGKGKATVPVANVASSSKQPKAKAAVPKAKASKGTASKKNKAKAKGNARPTPPRRKSTPPANIPQPAEILADHGDPSNPKYFKGNFGMPVLNPDFKRPSGQTAKEYMTKGARKPVIIPLPSRMTTEVAGRRKQKLDE